MWIVLAILKWIGIIFGGILGLLLFLSALVIFVPIRYYVRGSNREGATYSFRFSWLSVAAIKKKPQSDKIMLTIFGIPVRCLAGGEKGKQAKQDESSKAEPVEDTQKEEPAENTQKEEPEREKEKLPKQRNKASPKKKAIKKKKNFSFGRVSSIIGLIKDSKNRRIIRKLLREIKLLLQYLAPTKMNGKVVVGTGDPCTTGLLLGGISLFPVVYQEGVHIVPDFEEKHFEAEGFVKGRIRMIYFLRLLYRLYQDRELKELWKQINKVKKEAA